MISTAMPTLPETAGATLTLSLFEIDGGGHPGAVDKKLHTEAHTPCPEKAMGGKGGALLLPKENDLGYRSMSTLLKGRIVKRENVKEKFAARVAKNEREQIQQFFYARLAPSWGGKRPLSKSFFGILTGHLKLEDWHYMKSLCTQEEQRGSVFAKVFWGSLKDRQV